jgi:hypothetical protein
MYCIVALILGMLLANMLKSVCGCKVVEGNSTKSHPGSDHTHVQTIPPATGSYKDHSVWDPVLKTYVPIKADCVLGDAVGAGDCTSLCGTVTQTTTTAASGGGACAPGTYACQAGDGDCPAAVPPCKGETLPTTACTANGQELWCTDGTVGYDNVTCTTPDGDQCVGRSTLCECDTWDEHGVCARYMAYHNYGRR